MKTMTATEASRSFSAVLNEAEHGETIVVTKDGRRVAMISPPPLGSGAALIEFERRFAGTLDDDFGRDVAAAREAVYLDEPPWDDD